MIGDGRRQLLNVELRYAEDLVHIENTMADFIYEDGFVKDWEDCGLNLEHDLWNLETLLTALPESGPVIPNTGGLRKTRFGKDGGGKRGGVRVIYMWIPEIFIFYMFMVYGKSVKDDLSERAKKILRREASEARERLFQAYG